MKRTASLVLMALWICSWSAAARPQGSADDAASIVAACKEAMGGAGKIDALRTLRVTMIYPDHEGAPVVQEIARPNRLRSESAGRFISVFDGTRAAAQNLDPAKRGAPQAVPAEMLKDYEVDLAWIVPAFFDYPAVDGGAVEHGGVPCRKLTVTLPHGAAMVYLVDASTRLVKTISVDLAFEGKAFHMEREWVGYRDVQGIRYPAAMTYPGRDGSVQKATIASIEVNPVLGDERFRLDGPGRE